MLDSSVDMKLPDEGKQTKFVFGRERFGPEGFLVGEEVVGRSEKDGMEMGDGGGIPRVAGEGARAETAHVAAEMNDDDFDDLQGKPHCRGRAFCASLRGGTPKEYSPVHGQGSVPNKVKEQLDC